MDVWKKVDGYGDMYEVSDLGHVRSWHKSSRAPEIPHVLSPGSTVSGYRFVVMCDGKGKRRNEFVHTLVAESFICARPWDGEDWTVNHKDFDKANNRADNLEWMPHADNIRHSAKSIPRNRGEANHSKLKEHQVREIRRRWLEERATLTSLAKEFGVSLQTCSAIIKRKKWAHVI